MRARKHTLHPSDVFQRSNRIGGMHPLVCCNADLCVHQYRVQRIEHQGRPLDHYEQAPEDERCYVVSLIVTVSGRTVANKPRTSFRIRQVHCNAPRYADLIELEIRVASDHGSGRKVYTLSHEVTTESTFLPFQAGANRFNGTSRFLECLWNSSDIIVHVSGDVELAAFDEYLLGSKKDSRT